MKHCGVLSAVLAILAGIVGVARDGYAMLTEPDVVYFGALSGGSAGSFVKLKLDADGTTLASAAVANDLSFVLRVPMDLLDPRVPGSARKGDQASLYLGEKAIRSVVLPDGGSVINLTLAATPPTPDDWQRLHPGDDGSGDLNRNGIGDLRDFLNGNDPAACIWSAVDASHVETAVFHGQVLQNCLTEAQADGRHNLIKVAKGTYFGNFTYSAAAGEEFDLRVVGGYDPAGTAGSCERMTSEPSETVLVGDKDKNENKDGRVFDIDAGPGQSPSTVRIEAFRIMCGGYDWTSGVDRDDSNALQGGGVRVRTNQADVELVGNMLSDNFAYKGGAVQVISSGPGSVLLVNNIISNNAAFQTGAVMIASTGSGAVTLLNNTIVENWAENDGPGASVLVESDSAPVDLSNNIIRGVPDFIWSFDVSIINPSGGGFPLTVRNNILLDAQAFETDMPGFVMDASNITADPFFVQTQSGAYYYFPTDGDYRLQGGSPGIDKGIGHPLLPPTDPDGRERSIGGSVDMGAYERPAVDDAYPLNPVALHDPIMHTELSSDGMEGRVLVTNTAGYTFKVRVTSPFSVKGLTVVKEGGEPETLTVDSDNSFAYNVVLEPGDTWLNFEVTKSDDAKVPIWYLITLDTELPAVTLASTAPGRTNAASIPVTVAFGEEVSGFEAADVVVANGSIVPSSFSGSKDRYAFAVTPAGDGTVSIGIPAGAARDTAGNGNLAAAPLDLVYDTVSPGVILSSTLPGATYVSPIPVAVAFSEPVTGFDAASLIVRNGAINAFSGTDAGYTFTVTPTGQNVTVTVDVAVGAVRDAAGNPSTAAAQLVRQYAPPIVIEPTLPKTTVSPEAGYYNKSLTLTMTATENAAIYYTMDGTAPSTASPRYTSPLAVAATVRVRYFAVDVAGNSEAPITLDYVIDREAPLLHISTLADGKSTNNATLNVAGQLSDNSGIKELRINNVGVTVENDGSFSWAVALLAGNNQIVTTVTDLAGNQASDTRTVTLDQTAATLSLSSPADNSKSAKPSTAISGSTDGNAVIALKVNGLAAEAVTRNGNGFTGTVHLAVGLNTIEITATDPAGNVATAKRSVTYDNRQPTLAVTQPDQDMRSNQRIVLIKGMVADSQSAVTVTVNDVTVTVGTDGSFELPIELSEEKSYPILVTATDEAGHRATVQRNIVYDTTASAFTVAPLLTPTNDRSQSVAGTREPGATISVACPTATVGAMSYPTPESWQVLLSGFAVGRNTITVTGADAAGNSAVRSAEVAVGNIYGGPKTIALNAPTGMDIYYSTDGTTPTAGSSRYTGPLTLSETTTFSYFAIDGQGNKSEVTRTVYTIDTTAPALDVVSLSQGVTANNGAYVFVIAGTVTDNTRVNTLTVNDVAVPFSADGSFSATVTLGDGATAITSVATDVVGNRSTATRTVDLAAATIDATAPDLAITRAPASLEAVATAEFAFTSTDTTASFQCQLDAGPFASCTSPVKYTMPADGQHSFSVRAKDPAGNVSGDKTATWTSDTTIPDLSVSALSNHAATNVSPLNITGTAIDANGIASLAINGNAVSVASSGAFSYALPLGAEGDVAITVVATDKAGNRITDSRTVIFDSALPELTVNAPADNSQTREASLGVTGSVGQAGTIDIRNTTNNSTEPALLDGAGYSGSIQLATGSNTLEVSLTDAAGRKLTTVKRTVVYDPISPALAITGPAQDAELQTTGTTIRGTVTDAANTAVTVTFNGITYTPAVTAGLFEQAITIPAEGSSRVVATATDAFGNPPSTVTRNVIYTPFPGDTDGDGSTSELEAVVKVFQYAYGQRSLTEKEKVVFDCAPLGTDGRPSPDGAVDVGDVVLMLRKLVGLVNW